MPVVAPKKAPEQRIIDTIQFIESQIETLEGDLGLCAFVIAQHIRKWVEDEREEGIQIRRVGEALHLGAWGTKEDRARRRAVILIRVALQNQTIQKAKTDTPGPFSNSNRVKAAFEASLAMALRALSSSSLCTSRTRGSIGNARVSKRNGLSWMSNGRPN